MRYYWECDSQLCYCNCIFEEVIIGKCYSQLCYCNCILKKDPNFWDKQKVYLYFF